MSRQTKGTIFSVVIIVFVVMLIAGCEEELSNVKKHRLIAAENRQLKKQLAQLEVEIERQKKLHNKEIEKQKKLHNTEIEEQKKLHNTDIEKQKELLAKCLEEKKTTEEQFQQLQIISKDQKDRMESLITVSMEQNKELRDETGKLRKEIIELQRELEMYKGPKPLLHKD